MLKRRNTMHSSIDMHSQTNPFAPMDKPITKVSSKTGTTNPFLNSSSGNLNSISPTSAQPLKHKSKPKHHARIPSIATTKTTSSAATNPFLYQPTSYSTNPSSNDQEKPTENIQDCLVDPSISRGYQFPQKLKSHGRQQSFGGGRRLSLEVFKAPFGWHRRRRATCTSSDLKQMLTLSHGNDQSEEILRSSFTYLDQLHPQHTDTGRRNEARIVIGADVILKSSRYNPQEEEEVEKHHPTFEGGYGEGYDYERDVYADHEHIGRGSRYREQRAGGGFNPFLASESNPELATFAGTFPIEPEQEAEPEQSDHEPSWRPHERDENVTAYPTRRRHSVFSDWSIEDCPRLLAFQKKQQEKEQRARLGQDDGRQHENVLSSRASLTRSSTDTVLDQYQDRDNFRQHDRHTSACHRPHNVAPSAAPSSFANRPRRNTVVIGRNIVKRESGACSLHESPRLSSSNYSRDTEFRSLYEDSRQSTFTDDDTEDNGEGYEYYDNEHWLNQHSWNAVRSAPASVHPYDRPSATTTATWQPRSSLARRESQSYAQDFMKDRSRWIPPRRPWTSNSSSSSSPSSPLYQSTFPHERGDQEQQQEVAYHDREGVQMRPYGEEEDLADSHQGQLNVQDSHAIEANGEIGDYYGAKEEGYKSVYDFGIHLDHNDDPYHSDENDVRYYYNSMDWQDSSLGDVPETLDQQDVRTMRSGTTVHSRSRDLLTRRATLAKAKFYKLLRPKRSDGRDHQDQGLEGYPGEEEEDDDEEGGGLRERGSDVGLDYDPSRSANSVYSVTSSLRARMRLNPKTKTVLRQVKRRLSAAARTVISEANKAANSVISEANKAANSVTPILRSNTKRRSEVATSSRFGGYVEKGYGFVDAGHPDVNASVSAAAAFAADHQNNHDDAGGYNRDPVSTLSYMDGRSSRTKNGARR